MELGRGLLMVEAIIIVSTLAVYGATPAGVGLAVFYAAIAFLAIMSVEEACARIVAMRRARKPRRPTVNRGVSRTSRIDLENLPERDVERGGDLPLGGLWAPTLLVLLLGLVLIL